MKLFAQNLCYTSDAGTGSGLVRQVYGLHKTSPSTLSDAESDAIRLDAKGGVVVAGHVAHDAVDTGNPVKVGARALATLPTAVAASDRSDLLTDLYGRLHVTAGQRAESWTAFHKPAANTVATISKAAGGAAVRHVCKGFMVGLSNNAAAASSAVTVQLRDGATGAGTVLWETSMAIPATAFTSQVIAISGLYIVGTANTAMTLEFSGAAGANTLENVNIFGESIPA